MALVACLLFGLAVSMPVDGFAQSKAKTVTHHATKGKKAVRQKTLHKATTTKVKAVLPKPGVVNAGTFKPLRSDSRMTVILPRRPAAGADLTIARNRTTVYTVRSITPSNKTLKSVTASNFGTTAMIVKSRNTSWWGYGGPSTSTYYDARYGWITTVAYSWGNVMYTYGYQVVNYWKDDGYVWIAYPGVSGVAYPVLYR